MLKTLILSSTALAAASESTTLTISPALQVGFFTVGDDVGALNPHAYRPNEFVTNDFVFEGLVAWDPTSDGADGVAGTSDDFVVGALAESWSDNEAAVAADGTVKYEITFTLRSGVSFHDGQAWDADAAALNFDHILGGSTRSWSGFHDWYGLGGAIESWTAVDTLTFKVTFKYYYEAALRELTFIRPFRFASPLSLPSLADGEISCAAWRRGAIRGTFDGLYTCRGVKSPVGTGPYKIVNKLLKKGTLTRTLPAADFNASCYSASGCSYETGEHVAEVHFDKYDGYVGNRAAPTYDKLVVKAYATTGDIKAALVNGTLDIAYGDVTMPQASFVTLATDVGAAANLSAHESSIKLNTRSVVFNSAGALNTKALRKMVMSKIQRSELYSSELAEEVPADTLFEPSMPYCGITLTPMDTLMADTTAAVSDIVYSEAGSGELHATGQALRFIYRKDIPHQQMIASKVIADLYTAGISVVPIPLLKSDYNAAMNSWLGPDYDGVGGDISFDIALSETWGPSYDPTSKLFDMTYEWGSGEADTIATNNLESMAKSVLTTKIRDLSKTADATARTALYTEVLTTLHDEAIFLPLTYRKNIAVVNSRVSGFAFGSTEFDIPISSFFPTPPPEPEPVDSAIIIVAAVAAVVVGILVLCLCCLLMQERAGKPVFKPVTPPSAA